MWTEVISLLAECPAPADCNNEEDGVMDDWAKKRLAELEAAAPAKRKKAAPSVMLSLSWAAEAAIATKSRKAMVWVWLVYRAWQTEEPNCCCAQRRASEVRHQ